MSKPVSVPDHYHTVTPSIVVANSIHAIALYEKVFNARKREVIRQHNKVVHAEIQIGDAIIMMADENAEWGLVSPSTLAGTASSLYVYSSDVDTLYHKAIEHSFTSLMAPSDMFWGDRFAQVKDPFGHIWSLATHIEDVSEAEIQRRVNDMDAE
ncbi:VOC family protein [Aestuariibacter sp. AA17]|uniref:VOC family protein n=1 Tax=Fluctibacter corallii TaxID=2984329 RepID=A0ABT3AAR0_9ALTE|nr:VOC family protein [Aestuariibacter sp. AA17]MCV2885662.1 VOC family protein [Aestuariibacter sp. AA17]